MGFLGAYTHGSTVIFPSQIFEADAVLDVVEAERCTAILGALTMFVAELEAMSKRHRHLGSLKKALAAGSLVLPALMRRMGQDMVREGRNSPASRSRFRLYTGLSAVGRAVRTLKPDRKLT
jgi:acyl-CoA synthetase (AMP-forming)/AMP-acid ligase II